MRVIVTGGAGFIGSHIAEDLVGGGHDVVVLDDLSTGKKENVPEGARLIELDIRDTGAVDAAFAEFKPEVVAHQAAQTSVSVSTREPLRDAEVNVLGSLNVLAACHEHGTERLVFASTGGAIYGEVPSGERAQIDWPTRPISPYACSKLAFEGYLGAARATTDLDCRILRYANVYGPRQDPHGEAGVVAIFAKRLLAQQPISIFAMREEGDAGCIRDYVLVRDVVAANRRSIEGADLPPIVNVCTGVETTTLQIAEALRESLGQDADFGYGPIRGGDLERSVLEPSTDLDDAPASLGEGIAITARWFAEER